MCRLRRCLPVSVVSERLTVLDQLRADRGAGWYGFLHLNRRGQVVRLYLKKGAQWWKVDDAVPDISDRWKLGGTALPWEAKSQNIVWRAQCDRPQLWRGIEAEPRAAGLPQGITTAIATIEQLRGQ